MSGAVRYGSGGPFEASVGYSRVVVAGDQASTAGCTSIVDGEVVHEDDAFAQTITAFGIGLEALRRAGFDVTDVVQTRMYVVGMKDWSVDVGRAHGELFADVRPAATMLGVTALIDPRLLVEVELVAHRAQTAAAGSA